MLQADAKRQVCDRFTGWTVQWRKDNPGRSLPSGNDAFLFYVAELEGKQSQMLRSRARGDKWRTVHVWLRQAGLASRD